MMKTKIFFLLAVITLLATGSCNKYEEDDERSLRKPEKRLMANIWVNAGVINYITNKPAYGNLMYGSASGTIKFNSNNVFRGKSAPYFYFDGTWELMDNKEKIKITNSTSNTSVEYEIHKLDKNDLWLQDDSLQYEFTKQKPS